MQNIDINTTQNVVITYEVAKWIDRVFAFLIDVLIMGGGFIIAMIGSSLIIGNATSWFFYLIAAPIFLFYTLICEIRMNGQTFGKRSLNLQVVKVNGKEAKVMDYFIRWIFRLIDIYLSLGTIATIFIGRSKKGQRLGDLISETSVIRIKPSKSMVFQDIAGNYDIMDYQPQYASVRHFSEKDMLLIHNVYLRTKKYHNKAHEKVLHDLVKQIQQKINLSDQEIPKNKLEFLRTLIKDYTILTR